MEPQKLERPNALPLLESNIPQTLAAIPHWLAWYYQRAKPSSDGAPPKKEWTKVPWSAICGPGSVTNRKSWSTLSGVVNFIKLPGSITAGIGFVLTDTENIVAVDLDHCRDKETGEIEAWAQEIISRFDSYTELSPSGTGIRIVCLGKNSGKRNKKGDVELYDARSPRYVTITRHRLEGVPVDLMPRQEAIDWLIGNYLTPDPEDEPKPKPRIATSAGAVLIDGDIGNAVNSSADAVDDETILEKALHAKNGDKFRRLWSGDWQSAGFNSQSEADQSLCNMLAFWIGHDEERIDRLFRQSGLYRDKWERHDYRSDTISKAMKRSDVHDWSTHSIDPDFDPAELFAQSQSVADNASGATKPAKKNEKTQFHRMMDLLPGLETWKSPDGQAFAAIKVDSHFDNLEIDSTAFQQHCTRLYFKQHNSGISRDTLKQIIDVLSSMASDIKPVYLRVARVGDTIWIDLGTPTWEAVEITGDGWKIVSNPPVKFRRTKNTAALPIPTKGGSLDALKPLCATSDEGWIMIKGWILQCFQGHGPYIALIVSGEQGSAKSSLCTLLKRFVDPVKAGVKSSLPKDETALVIDCKNEFAILYDNVSYLPPWTSDAICRVATGGGLKARKYYTNNEQVVFDFCAPVILNGIPDFAENGDLLSRSLIVNQPIICDDARKTEADLKIDLTRIESEVMGGIFDLISAGLRDYPSLPAIKLPRMADSVKWVTACFGNNDFLDEFRSNQEEATEIGIEASPVASAIKALMASADDGNLPGTTLRFSPQELLTKLKIHSTGETMCAPSFPKNARALGNRLKRDAPLLRKQGFDVCRRKSGSSRYWEISRIQSA